MKKEKEVRLGAIEGSRGSGETHYPKENRLDTFEKGLLRGDGRVTTSPASAEEWRGAVSVADENGGVLTPVVAFMVV